ncbi:MAG: hypothetical protein AD742_18025 [Methylibium sp. NZG]|nr:MAG: hypothetical protein AD742_18025 [Methylibium sp. NZG]
MLELATPTTESPVLLVLDTNVVLDWLVFRDPGCDALAGALTAGAARWVATQAMRDELERVLMRGSLDAWRPDASALWAAWARSANMVPAPPQPLPRSPRCTDPDDQPFIDLALHVGASALLSRDRAVLRCARGARALGLAIMPPAVWGARR